MYIPDPIVLIIPAATELQPIAEVIVSVEVEIEEHRIDQLACERFSGESGHDGPLAQYGFPR